MPRPLDSGRQHPLMQGAISRNAAWDNFPPLIDKSPQHPFVMITDRIYLFFAKTADPPSSPIKVHWAILSHL
jgi:hypothetical protein